MGISSSKYTEDVRGLHDTVIASSLHDGTEESRFTGVLLLQPHMQVSIV